MARQIIKLTEQDLHNIIREAVNKAINEGFGDWRDDYDAMQGYFGNDVDKQKELRGNYEKNVKDAFGDDEKARIKALNRHMDYRDSLRNDRLDKSRFKGPNGENYLDWEAGWNTKYNAEHGIGDESINDTDLDTLIAQAAKRRERGRVRTKSNAEKLANSQKPSKFDGLSADELEAKFKELGYGG